MNFLKTILRMLATTLGFLAALASILLFVQLHWPSPALWFVKLYVSALSPLLVAAGAGILILGLAAGSKFTSVLGIFVVMVFSIHIFRITRPPESATGFTQAFGEKWEERMRPGSKNRFLPGRFTLKLPAVLDSRLEPNIVFDSIPGSGRPLLCDIWQPPPDIAPSGLAFVYMHGSAWYILDKDLGTRPFFGHLAAQGHVVMDVAYRLAPETDMMGMVQDMKRAIHWMRKNGKRFGVRPDKIVLSGGSAGAHLALMAAYTSRNRRFTPAGLEGEDLGVSGVVSLYGPTDLAPMYFHINQHRTTRDALGHTKKPVPMELPAWMKERMGDDFHRLGFDRLSSEVGTFAPLLGGHPDEVPEVYALYSPLAHVHAGCPPTLLIHGNHDVMAPVATARALFVRLKEAKVPAVLHVLPQTDHAFDLILPRISPSAHNALYDVERFLALQAAVGEDSTSKEGGLVR